MVPAVKKRRTSEAARRALLDSAAAMFARRGYGGASTKEIARGAGTSETAIYTQFGSKAELFKAAVVEPFTGVLEEYTADFRGVMASGRDDDQLVRDFVAEIYDHFDAHKDAVLALISATGEPEAQDAVREAVDQIQAMFDHLNVLSTEVWQQGARFDLSRAPMIHRLIHGMLISMTVLEPLFMPDGRDRPTREQIIDDATDILVNGILDKG